MALSHEKSEAVGVSPDTTHEHLEIAGIAEFDNGEIAPEAIGGTTKDLPPGYYYRPQFIGTMLAVSLGYISATIAYLIPANLLTVINEDIGPNKNYTWFAIVWNLASAVGLVFVGRVSDLIGRRWLFIIGNGLGFIGSIICATAHSIPVFIIGGAFIGLAASVQMSYATVVSELVPNKHRGIALGFLALSTVPTQAFGAIIGHALVQYTKQGWRWVFYLSIITHCLCITLYFLCYYPPTYHMLHARSRKAISLWRMLDPLGAILFTAGLLLFLLGLSWGGQMYPWKSGKVIGTIVSGAAVLVAFVFWEIYGAGEYPLIPMKFFRNAGYVGVLGIAGIANAAWAPIVLIWPIQLTVVWPNSFILVGWKSCILQCGTIIGMLAAALLAKTGMQKCQMITATVILTAFLGGMAGTDSTTPTMALLFILITCIAVGYVEIMAFVIAPFCLKPEDIGIALGLVGTSRSTLSSITQAIFVTILNNKVASNIPKYVIPSVLSAGLPETSLAALLQALGTGDFSQVPDINPSIVAAAVEGNKEAYVHSFKIVYLVGIAFAVLGIVSGLFVPDCEDKFTDGVARKLHGGSKDSKDKGNTDKQSGAYA
ncbi:fungal trichothecene efflux pump [Aspergillus unguis]